MYRVIFLLVVFGLLSSPVNAALVTHVVQRGDTLFRIAQRYGGTVSSIAAANSITNPDRIYVGQSLVIPDAAAASVDTDEGDVPDPAVEDGVYVVQRGDTLFRIANRLGMSVQALIAANGLSNPNLIYVGQRLRVVGGPAPQTTVLAANVTEAEPPQEAPPTAVGGASFAISGLHYSDGGRQAHMTVTVTNHDLKPALASGNWYPVGNPDGGRQWVTLLKAEHGEVPVPLVWDPVHGRAPLWEFRITTDDGMTFSAYAGCEYHETIVAEGFEPTADGGFHWTQTLEDGWFRCGHDYDGSPKPPADLLPGQSASVPLDVWLVHPREWGNRRIVQMDFVPYAPDGSSFGVQASVSVP